MAKRSRLGPIGTPGRKPDSVPPARSAFQDEFARRLRAGRLELARARNENVTQADIAKLLTQAAGYEVSAELYSKYERGLAMMPHDLLFHFAEATRMSLGVLLAPLPFQARVQPHTGTLTAPRSRTSAY